MRLLRWLPPLPLAVGALASGVLLALAYPPASMGSIAFVALIPVIVALYKKPYPPKVFFKTGYLFGVAFFLGHLWWIVGLVPSASITMPWLMAPALILLTAYLSVYPAVTFLLLRLLGKRGGLAAVLIAPALWGLTEMFRSSSELGFPWGAIGYSIVGRPMLIQTTAFWGLFGLGMLIVFVNMVWSQALLVESRKSARLLGVLGAVLLLSTAVHGQLKIRKFESTAPVPETTVAIAQPNVDLRLKWDPAFTDSTFRLIERFCREADKSGAEIVVFPETCAPVYIRYKPNYMNQLSLLAEELDLAIYIGFLDGRYEGPNDSLWVYNSSGLFDKNHVFGQYDKTHLLPFGEAIPFAWKYPSWGKLDFGQANFHPGPERPPVPSRVGAIGAMICFESIFPDLARDHTLKGAEVFFNITNDGWFGTTPGPYQHNDMAILRAVENHRYLVRSSNTGISMFVDPVGRVVSSLGLRVEGILMGSIRPIQKTTFYTRFGDTPVLIAALLMLLIGTLVARLQKTRGGE